MQVTALALGLALLLSSPALAVLADLQQEQIDEALAHGKVVYDRQKSAGEPIDEVEPEYRVSLGPSVGVAVLYTEFGVVALEARRWLAIDRQLTREALDAALTPLRGRLRFRVTLMGDRRDFIRRYTARLVQGLDSHTAASWDIFRSTQIPESSRWQTSAVYSFSTTNLNLKAPATLVLGDGAGGALRFEFPLDRLR